jgi:hypothetical protein
MSIETKKILIIDGSGFRNDLITVIQQFIDSSKCQIDHDVLPNDKIPTDKITDFIETEVNGNKYALVFCHLLWVAENIASLEQLKDTKWFQRILEIENRIGVSNGNSFREKAQKFQLFEDCFSHREATDFLKEVLNEYPK